MINLDKFKYTRKNEGQSSKSSKGTPRKTYATADIDDSSIARGKRKCETNTAQSDDYNNIQCIQNDNTVNSEKTMPAKKWKSDFISADSGSDDDDTQIIEYENLNSPTNGNDEDSQNSSELFVQRKKPSVLPNSEDENDSRTASNGLGLSSDESESDNDAVPESRKMPFPRLNCGIKNSNANGALMGGQASTHQVEHHQGTSDSNEMYNGASSMKKEIDESSQHRLMEEDAPNGEKEIDENFSMEDDDIMSDSSDDDYPHFGKNKRVAIMDFLQNASVDELMTMESCSQKKADIILALRPFKSWDNLLNKLGTTKHLTVDIVVSCSNLLKQRAILNRLLDQCRSISSSLTYAIQKLHCNADMIDGISLITKPKIIPSHLQLKPYQIVGLNWMVLLHRNKVNGVLADEMGLGKTVQTIAFLAHLYEGDPNTGPHIIVVPSSTLGNWHREFNLWCPAMEVVLYQGSQVERRSLRVEFQRGRTSNVIITTYNSAISTPEDRAFFRKLKMEYAIFDEGHMLKNMSSQRYVNLMKIKATRKLLLTGTPLQNNLMELMSLLRFVMPHMFEQTTETLVRIFKHSTSESKSKYTVSRIADAKNIMEPFVLRRLKATVLKQLPNKHVETIVCDMTLEQKRVYQETKEKFRLGLNKKSALEMKSAFIELRKVANHPLLRRNHYGMDILVSMAKQLKKYESTYRDSVHDLIVEDLTVMTDFEIHRFCESTASLKHYALDKSNITNSGKFKTLDRLLPDIKKQGCKAVIFSQWTMIIDILEEYLNERNYKFLRLDGSTPVNTRLGLIDKFESDPSIMVFLLSTKAGGLGINLTAANTVILHDIDLNPHNDKQAEDRCHRLGQTKDVKIIRLICKDSIEEGMLQLAKNKLDLEHQLSSAEKDESSDIATLLENTLAR